MLAAVLLGKNRPPLGDRSPLHFAAERGGPVILETLIAAGAKVGWGLIWVIVFCSVLPSWGVTLLQHDWANNIWAGMLLGSAQGDLLSWLHQAGLRMLL
jgi:hypothetical protein